MPKLLLVLITFLSLNATAEPWINTQDVGLRSDIETLSNIGVIKVPITTYPLMWAGIIKDLDQNDIREIPKEYKDMFWRVKSAGKQALRTEPKRILKLAVASSEQVFRSFGDSSRSEMELVANSASMNKHFAWNLQVNRVINPFDQDTFHYDGSYVAAIWGNWIASVGKVEKWWGASWDSANLLSNNARQPLGVSLDRNYPEAIDLPVLNWFGPISFSGFIGQLDDERVVDDPYLSGLSFTVKPLDSLEASIRTTSISGGSSRSFAVESDRKVLTSFDLRWHLPTGLNLPTNLYLSVTDEGQDSNFASQQFGISSSFKLFEQDWRVFLESTQTYASGKQGLNATYEDGFYQTGYRYNQRAIGSTYDNDSKVISLGLLGNLTRHQLVQIKLQSLKINQNKEHNPADVGHSISSENVDATRISINWKYQANKKHQFEVGVDVSDKIIDGLVRQNERVRVSASWSYYL